MKLKMRESILITLLLLALLPVIVLSVLNWYILSKDDKLDKNNILKSSVSYLYLDYLDDKNRLKIYTDNIAIVLDHFDYEENSETQKNLRQLLSDIKSSSKLDILTVIDVNKKVVSRANSDLKGDNFELEEVLDKVLSGQTVVSTEIISDKNLVMEGEELLEKTKIKYINNNKNIDSSRGLFLLGISPIYKDYAVKGKPVGAVISGIHLNRGFFEKDLIKKDSLMKVNVDIEPFLKNKKNDLNIDYVPLENHEGKPVANLVIWYNPKEINKMLSDAEVSSTIMYVLTSIFIFIISIFISKFLVKPIEILVNGTREIAKDNFEHKIMLHGPSEIEDLSHSFNKMAASLAEKRRMQEDFTATLTHDMRVPLLGEKKALDLLINDDRFELSEMQKILVENMVSSNNDLLKLVNTLLDTYKLEAGKYKLEIHECNLNDLITQIINEIKPLADEKEQELAFNEEIRDLIIKIDSHEIKRVIRNLLSNSIKFTQTKGKIQVNLYPKGKNIIISIADNGKGITEAAKAHLFERYASGAKKLKKVGTGLGLYLSYRIILAHGGDITVESEIDKGSVFNVSLPME